jgi:hypothetical protein
MKLLTYGIWIFWAGLFSEGSFAQGAVNDSIGNDTIQSVAIPADSGRVQDSESGNMYRAVISSMRRDVPRTDSKPDSSLLPQRIRIPDTITTTSLSSKPADSLHASQIPTSDQTNPAELQIKLTKKAIIIAVGSCGLIGCGIVAYLLKNSKKDDVVSRPAGIPPPPDPPQ